jgi:phosphoglycerol geranylgeranyltransferase
LRVSVYQSILEKIKQGKKQLAVLIDPDKFDSFKIIELANSSGVDYFFIGGSLMSGGNITKAIQTIKENSDIPVIIFPGSPMQICSMADAILLLSVISGRNPELLIGQHVLAAPYLKESGLEILSTGYMLVDSGRPTTASYISNTTPIPSDKNEIAVCTAMAGEMLGLKSIYLDGGSGASFAVRGEMIKAVKKNIRVPLIVGGGIKTVERAIETVNSGADLIVLGNVFEDYPGLLPDIADAVHKNSHTYKQV